MAKPMEFCEWKLTPTRNGKGKAPWLIWSVERQYLEYWHYYYACFGQGYAP